MKDTDIPGLFTTHDFRSKGTTEPHVSLGNISSVKSQKIMSNGIHAGLSANKREMILLTKMKGKTSAMQGFIQLHHSYDNHELFLSIWIKQELEDKSQLNEDEEEKSQFSLAEVHRVL